MLLSRIVSLRNLKFLSTNLLTCHIKWLSLTSNIFDLSMSIGLKSSNLYRFNSRSLSKMVGVLGFEPRTSSLSGTRSNQLSYTPVFPQKVASPSPTAGSTRWQMVGCRQLRCLSSLRGASPSTTAVCNVLPFAARSTSLFYRALPIKFWWSRRGSNPRHPACKAGALAN